MYADLAPLRENIMPGDTLAIGMATIDRVLGLLAGMTQKADRAIAHFEEALSYCRNAGYRPALAWTCHDYAEMLLDPSARPGQGGAQDRAKAMSLLDESLAISSELGMRPLMERVLSRREILGA